MEHIIDSDLEPGDPLMMQLIQTIEIDNPLNPKSNPTFAQDVNQSLLRETVPEAAINCTPEPTKLLYLETMFRPLEPYPAPAPGENQTQNNGQVQASIKGPNQNLIEEPNQSLVSEPNLTLGPESSETLVPEQNQTLLLEPDHRTVTELVDIVIREPDDNADIGTEKSPQFEETKSQDTVNGQLNPDMAEGRPASGLGRQVSWGVAETVSETSSEPGYDVEVTITSLSDLSRRPVRNLNVSLEWV